MAVVRTKVSIRSHGYLDRRNRDLIDSINTAVELHGGKLIRFVVEPDTNTRDWDYQSRKAELTFVEGN